MASIRRLKSGEICSWNVAVVKPLICVCVKYFVALIRARWKSVPVQTGWRIPWGRPSPLHREVPWMEERVGETGILAQLWKLITVNPQVARATLKNSINRLSTAWNQWLTHLFSDKMGKSVDASSPVNRCNLTVHLHARWRSWSFGSCWDGVGESSSGDWRDRVVFSEESHLKSVGGRVLACRPDFGHVWFESSEQGSQCHPTNVFRRRDMKKSVSSNNWSKLFPPLVLQMLLYRMQRNFFIQKLQSVLSASSHVHLPTYLKGEHADTGRTCNRVIAHTTQVTCWNDWLTTVYIEICTAQYRIFAWKTSKRNRRTKAAK